MKALKQVPAVVCEYAKVRKICWACLYASVLLLVFIVTDVTSVVQFTQPVVHYTFIPLIIVLGMTCTEPRPTLAQLLGPM